MSGIDADKCALMPCENNELQNTYLEREHILQCQEIFQALVRIETQKEWFHSMRHTHRIPEASYSSRDTVDCRS